MKRAVDFHNFVVCLQICAHISLGCLGCRLFSLQHFVISFLCTLICSDAVGCYCDHSVVGLIYCEVSLIKENG